MSSDIAKFRDQLDKFFRLLEPDCAKDLELQTCKEAFLLGMKINPRDSVNLFISNIGLHADKILLGDETFFLQADETELGIDPLYLNLAKRIKILWVTKDAASKNTIKNFFKILLILGVIVVRDEKLRLIINKYRDPANPLVFK